jgi:hypothetical protein
MTDKALLKTVPDRAVSVYNLEVLLLHNSERQTYRARIANLTIDSVEKATARDAMATIVGQAKKLLQECMASNSQIPWLDPKLAQESGETRMLIPMHT